MLGGSSGTALSAAFKYAQRCTAEDVIVTLCPDTGRNYLSKIYNEEWMRANGFAEQFPAHTVTDIMLGVGSKLDAIPQNVSTIPLGPASNFSTPASRHARFSA